MKLNKNTIKGITLLEVMLVLVIGATIIAMSFRFYYRYRQEYYYNQVQNNVTTLFEGLRRFYYVNCQEGLLSPVPKETDPPTVPPPLDEPFSVKIQEQLLDKKYLPAGWPTMSDMVDPEYTGTTEYQGYSAKFIPKQSEGREASACYNLTGSVQCSRGNVTNVTILNWQMQVVVKMINANYAQNFLNYTAANCVIKAPPPDNKPVDCAQENDPEGEYAVFQAMPSMISSDLWPTMPVVKEFNLLYTHDPMYELYNPSIGTGATEVDKKYKYYLCGG